MRKVRSLHMRLQDTSTVQTQRTLLVNLSSWPFVTTAEEVEVSRVWSAVFEPRPRPVPARPLPRPCFFLFELSKDGLVSVTSKIFAASFAEPWFSNYKRIHQVKRIFRLMNAQKNAGENHKRLTIQFLTDEPTSKFPRARMLSPSGDLGRFRVFFCIKNSSQF